MDLFQDLLEAVGARNIEIKRNSELVQNLVNEQKQAGEDVINSMKDLSTSSIEVLRAKELTALEAQNKTRDYASSLGTNPDTGTNVMNALAEDWKDSAATAANLNKELLRKTQSSFFDSPVQWLKDQITLEDTEKAAKIANYRASNAEQRLTFAQTQTQQAAQTQNALAVTRTEKTIQDTLTAASAELNIKTKQAQIQNTSINIAGIDKLQQYSLQELNNLSTALSAKNQQEQLSLSRQNLELSKKQFDAVQAERVERIQQKKADRQEVEDLADIVRKGAAALGFPDVNAIPTSKIMQLLNLKDSKFKDFLDAGMKSTLTSYPVISENAGESARILVDTGAPLRDEQQPIKRFLLSVWNNVRDPKVAMAAGYDPNKKDQVTAATGRLATLTASSQMKNIKLGDASNIYAPPPLTSVVTLPAIKNSALYANVFAAQMQTGVLKEFNPEQLVSMTVAGIKNKQVTYSEAAEGLQGLFNAAKSINNATKNYPGFGLPVQTGYNTQLETGLGLLRSYDMTQIQSINQILNSKLSESNLRNKNIRESYPFTFN